MKAFVFPGQGAQFSGMGKDLYNASARARERFEEANNILGFDISNIMFEGSDEADAKMSADKKYQSLQKQLKKVAVEGTIQDEIRIIFSE